MNSKERVLTSLRGGQPDRVPIVETPDLASLLNLAAALGIPSPGPEDTYLVHRMACRLVLELGLDAMLMPDPLDVMEHDGGIIRDRFGSEYRESVHGEPYLFRGPVEKLEDTVGLDMRPAVSSADFAPIAVTRDALGPERPVIMWLTAPFKLSWRLRGGMQELLTDFAKRPELVHALARVTTDLLVSMVEGAADAGVDAIILAGDIAGEEGPLFSPRHFREYVRPYYEEIVASSHARNMPVIYHGDGNMWPFMEEIIDIGFHGFNPIQPQCMDIAEVKRSVGDRLCLVGNIDCRDLLCTGTEEEVERVVRETIAIAAPGGGYMLHSSNSLHHDVRPENYIAMVRAGQKYGIYPD